VFMNKQEKYSAINNFRFIQVITTVIITLISAALKTEHALIIGFVSGVAAATLFTMRFLKPKFDKESLSEVLTHYSQFPKYGTWSSLLNNISRNSMPILLSQFFSTTMVGYYSYATRLLNAPTGMYVSALGQVYYKTAAQQDMQTLRASTQRIIIMSAAVAVIPTIVILIFGKDIFFSLFSGEWMEAGKISQYLILWYFAGVVVSPVSTLLDVKNKLRFELVFNLLLLLLRFAAVIAGGIAGNFYLSLLLFAVTGTGMNLYLLYYINYRLLKE
jgi:lipopolysaccharide exporter